METGTIGELALFIVGVVGSVVGAAGLRDAARRRAWLRWSGNERAARISRRRVRALTGRLALFVVAAVVGGIGLASPGWFFPGVGIALALGLGVSAAAGILDELERRAERSPDVRAELDADGFGDYVMPIR